MIINKLKELLSHDLLKKGLSDSSFYALAVGGSKLINFFIIPFLLAIISIEEFAKYDIFLLSSTFVLIILTLGVDSGAAIKIVEKKDSLAGHSFILSYSLLLSFLVFLILLAGVNISISFIESIFFTRQFINYILFYSFCLALQNIIFSFIRWKGEAKKAALVIFISGFSGNLLGYLSLYFYGNALIETFIEGLILGNIVGVIFSILLSWQYYSVKLPINAREEFKDLMFLSVPFVGASLGIHMRKSVDRFLILSVIGDVRLLGLYALIIRIAEIPNFAIQLLGTGFHPILLSNYQTEKGQKFIRNFFHISLIVFLPIIMVSLFISEPLILLFSNREFLEVSHLLPVALGASLSYSVVFLDGYGYMIKRKTHYYAILVFLGSVIYLLFAYLFIVLGYSLEGITLAYLVSSIFTGYLYIYISEKLYSFGYSKTLIGSVFFVILLVAIYSLISL